MASTGKTPANAREYVVLRETADGWCTVEDDPGVVYAAATDVQAIRLATEGLTAELRSGTFVAVPLRSWRPRTRAVEVREVDRWT